MSLCPIGRELQQKATLRVIETVPLSYPSQIESNPAHREELLAFERAFREHLDFCRLCRVGE